MATGEAHVVEGPDARQAAVQMLNRARNSQLPRGGRRGYDLKVSFMVNSGGQTRYDGEWQMEEMFLPDHGFRWTAKSSSGFSGTAISNAPLNFGEGMAGGIPLRLEQVRAALFGAVPTAPDRYTVRTTTAMYRGIEVTCLVLSGEETVPTKAPGRRWDEIEECIDPQSGLLQTHSQVPGWFYAYDYTDAPKLADRTLPRKVTVTEAGKTVIEIHVDSWTPLADADLTLFTPTKEMTWTAASAQAQKMFVHPGKGSIPKDATIQPVCIFGVVTPAGELAEAHSMQPSDPNSQAALDYAKTLTFTTPFAPAGPEQHFEFIIVKFVSQ
jgi:hypothetical protein